MSSLKQTQEQRQKLSVRQVLHANLLQLNAQLLEQRILKEISDNPVLELSEQDDPQKYNDEVIFPDKVKVNLEYYENQTLWLDIKIIFATILRSSY